MMQNDILLKCKPSELHRLSFGGYLTAEEGISIKFVIRRSGDEIILSRLYEDWLSGKSNDHDDPKYNEYEFERVCREQKDCTNCPVSECCNDKTYLAEYSWCECIDKDYECPDSCGLYKGSGR